MTDNRGHRFGVLVDLDVSPETLEKRFRWLEHLGFDQLFLPDHLSDYRGGDIPWHDAWSLLAAAASWTERIRIGTLVANPILRPAATMAKQVATIDRLSGGRFEFGIGSGILPADHHATGTEVWSVKERVDRFAEYVEILDGILRADGTSYTKIGNYLQARDVATLPGPVQHSRPPIIVGGHAPTVLRVAARYADTWNTNGRWGGGIDFGASFDDVLRVVSSRSRTVDQFATEIGRDPATIRRSFLLDPFEPGMTPGEVLEKAIDAGFDDFVFGWPADEKVAEFEKLALDVLPRLHTE